MNPIYKIIRFPFELIYRIIRELLDLLFPQPRVVLHLSSEPYFVGSYAKIKAETRKIGFDELDFRIVEGAPGGYVSACRDRGYDSNRPDIMLCFGYRPGNYHLEVRKKADGSVLKTFEFTVALQWPDEKRGPSLSFTGISENISFNPAWGGGPDTPQNLNVLPAFGTRRIAIILIDCSDARYTTNATTLTAIRDRWMNEAVNGVNNAGRIESARTWFQEASYNNYDLTATIFGPINFPNTWGSYFNNDGSPKGAFWQQAVTECDSTINYDDFDNLIFVSEAFTDSTGNVLNAWPYGGAGTFTTAEGNKNLGVISMPREWGAGFRPDRNVRATIIHELGHSLGLGDQYKPDTGRNTGNWEPMNTEDLLPHYTIAHRMMLGWVQDTWLRLYNFANGGGGVVNETISLSPIERGAPPAGQKTGIEIRIADGWNYYAEFRSPQSTQIGDRSLPVPDAALVTDVDSTPGDAPISRPVIILVGNDLDSDGSVLTNGADYEATDSSDPTYPTDFKLSVSGITADKADSTVQYGINSKPDPSIRPWPASAERQWQSPDIEVQNARNLADPANWFNVPWAGNPNTVIAKVTNNGDLPAPKVRVEFAVKNYNVGGAPETPLPADIERDIPARGSVNFTTSWNPPGNGHYCIIVRIPGYMTPPPNPVIESSIFNNLAQSNYDRFISATASPATREITQLEVGNPYDFPTMVYIRPGQTNPLYRTYVEHTYVYLNPGETTMIRLMFEYDPNNIYSIPVSLGKTEHIDLHSQDKSEQIAREILNKHRPLPNRVGVIAYIDNPTEEYPHTPSRLGGVDAEIVTGEKTQFKRCYRDGNTVGGTVMLASGNENVNSGKVILTVKMQDGQENLTVNEVIDLDEQGVFRHTLRQDKGVKISSIHAYYLPGPGLADCTSDPIV